MQTIIFLSFPEQFHYWTDCRLHLLQEKLYFCETLAVSWSARDDDMRFIVRL